MKSVMISTKPKWCELIASGQKTIEVRKSRPKLETPFKCYIYCVKDPDKLWVLNEQCRQKYDGLTTVCANLVKSESLYEGNGKVIGEFVCDRVDTYDDDTIHAFSHENYTRWNDYDLYQCCIHPENFEEYAADEWLYGWHISDLVIYDKPMELSDFWKAGKCPYVTENGCTYRGHCSRAGQTNRCGEPLARPPQSWCYVEEVA